MDFPDTVSCACVCGDKLYVSLFSGDVYETDTLRCSLVASPSAAFRDMAAAGTLLYAISARALFVIDTALCVVTHTRGIPAGAEGLSTIAVADGWIAVGDYSGAVHVLEHRGAHLAMHAAYREHSDYVRSCLVREGRIYACSHDGLVTAYNIARKKLVASCEITAPLVALVPADPLIHAADERGAFHTLDPFDPDFEPKKTRVLSAGISEVHLAGSDVFLTSEAGDVYALPQGTKARAARLQGVSHHGLVFVVLQRRFFAAEGRSLVELHEKAPAPACDFFADM